MALGEKNVSENMINIKTLEKHKNSFNYKPVLKKGQFKKQHLIYCTIFKIRQKYVN